jgi:hypothetical protein
VHLRILSDHQKHGLKNDFFKTRNMGSKMMLFNVWSGNIRDLMHLRILPDHQNQVFEKDIF